MPNIEPEALINSHQFLFLRKNIMTKTVDKIPRMTATVNGVTFSFSNSIRGIRVEWSEHSRHLIHKKHDEKMEQE